MTTVLLTGATGFVGRHILKELESREVNVVLILRENWQDRITINETTTRVIETPDLFSVSLAQWCDATKAVDTIIHAAWCAEPGTYLTSEKNLDCLAMTLQLAKAAVASKVKRFVGLGTCIEYAMSDKPLGLDSPLAPETPYSAAKVASFLTLQQWFKHTEISFLWCRLFHLFGDGEHPNRLFPAIHRSLQSEQSIDLTHGTQIRDLIPVDVAAKMIVDGAFSTAEGPANICSGQGRSVRELAEEIADQYGRRDLLNFGARPENLIDPPKIVGVPSIFE